MFPKTIVRGIPLSVGLVAASAVFMAGLAACGPAPSTSVSVPPNAVRVVIKGNPLGNPDSLYKPGTIRVHVGQTVVWVDRDDSKHTVTPDGGSPGWRGGSPILSTGQRYAHRFERPGTYLYHCMVHVNMLGTVVVIRG